MTPIANVLTGLVALAHVGILVLEMFFWDHPVGRRIFAMTPEVSASSKVLYSLFRWHEPGAVYLFAGGVLYLVGSLLVTIVFNVPRNEALASVAPAAPNSASLWAGYVASWTAWNHVRTAASLAAAASFSIALSY